MSSYSATMIVKGEVSGNLMAGSGSFANICIDGRHSQSKAIEMARKEFQSEANFKNREYLGFAIEKTDRFVSYKEPLIVDNTAKASEIGYLI